MLTEQRYEMILALLKEKKSVTVTEITDLLGISESTARRDINALSSAGRLKKVFGGAVLRDSAHVTQEPTVAQKENLHREEKLLIARRAANMIEDSDMVYLDAGTTTGGMIEFLAEKKSLFVTNAVAHAQRLAKQGNRVLLVGGELKGSTEAVIGAQAMEMLLRYHFTKGFFGVNGVTRTAGFTTPDAGEASVKRTAVQQCEEKYFLADSTKFGAVSAVTFAPYGAGKIITEQAADGYGEEKDLILCRQ